MGRVDMAITHPLLDAAAPAYSTSTLVVAIGRPAPWVFLSRVDGHLTAEGARRLADAVRSQTAAESRMVVMFNEWSRMTDYDGGARVLLTDVTRSLQPRLSAIHLFLTSSLVAFGVRAANLILKNLTVHSHMETFRTALVDAASRPTLTRPH